MTHDPYCEQAWQHTFTPEEPCGICAAIRKVREDEQDRQYEAQSLNWCKGYAAALRDAVEAVKALSPWRQTDPDEVCAAIEALATAQSAVAEPDNSPGGAS